MNERIKELIVKVLGKEGVIESRAFGHWALDDAELEKFAELIIKECAAAAFRLAPSDESACDISAGIEEHFGVK